MSSLQGTTFRFAIIGIIVLAMMIPLFMVGGITHERQQYFDETFRDIASSWGNAQHISGPFLVVPEVERYQVKNDAGELAWRTRVYERVFLPSSLNLDIKIDHQYRKRAIYEVPVYISKLSISGSFPTIDPGRTNPDDLQLRPAQARVVVGISHTQAIKTASSFKLGVTTTSFTAGSGQTWIGSGISAAATALSANEETPFSFELEIKGSHELGFTPLGNTTQVQMRSTWPHPSFGGSYLPERYEITNEGFTANWNLHELARNLPNNWRVDNEDARIGQHLGTVKLFQPNTSYRIIDRATKYGMLFIALTFLGFVCFEMTANLKFHPVQYGVVGVGLVLFYLALLSLSEHITFGLSYTLSTTLLTSIMGWYVWAMTKTWRLCLWMAAIVSSLYTTLYVLLQLEDYALLVGTTVLFVGLLALMYTTRSLTVESSRVTRE